MVHRATSGFTSMPPLSPMEGEAQARAHAVRKVLRHIESTPHAIKNV